MQILESMKNLGVVHGWGSERINLHGGNGVPHESERHMPVGTALVLNAANFMSLTRQSQLAALSERCLCSTGSAILPCVGEYRRG